MKVRLTSKWKKIVSSVSLIFIIGILLQSVSISDDSPLLTKIISDHSLDLNSTSTLEDHLTQHNDLNTNELSQSFYKDVFDKFNSFKFPKIELHRRVSDNKSSFKNKFELLSFLNIDPDSLQTYKSLHESVYDSLPDEFPSGLYKKNSRGIVFIGGDKYSWLSLLSIKSLRSFGCKLPIEIIIPTLNDYEVDYCEQILPSLDAKCVLLNTVLDDEVIQSSDFKGYQYKSLAIIASSFDELLLLDSDNVLISDPTKFFLNDPFKSSGLVLWPDYWERTTSPYWYDIVNITVENIQVRENGWPLNNSKIITTEEELTNVKYHDLQNTLPEISSESGQLMIKKSNHVKTILLSLFYNLNGPDFFYPILSLGESGEGDKDTFIAAAFKSQEPSYQVKSIIKSFGWFDSNNQFNGVAMGQKNPISDYEQFKQLDGLNEWEKFDNEIANVFTVHANYPKLNPLELMNEGKLIKDDKHIRLYGDIYRILPKLDDEKYYDFEKIQFKRMNVLLCDLNISLKCFNSVKRDDLCHFIQEHLDSLEDVNI